MLTQRGGPPPDEVRPDGHRILDDADERGLDRIPFPAITDPSIPVRRARSIRYRASALAAAVAVVGIGLVAAMILLIDGGVESTDGGVDDPLSTETTSGESDPGRGTVVAGPSTDDPAQGRSPSTTGPAAALPLPPAPEGEATTTTSEADDPTEATTGSIATTAAITSATEEATTSTSTSTSTSAGTASTTTPTTIRTTTTSTTTTEAAEAAEPGPPPETVGVGGFELGPAAGPNDRKWHGPGTTMGDWTVLSAVYREDVGRHGRQAGSGHVLNLRRNGAVTRTVSRIVPGQRYDLVYRGSRHAGAADGTVSARITVDGSSAVITPRAPSDGSWTTYTIRFVASASTVTVTLEGLDTPDGCCGVVLDNLQIVPVDVP
ncbi:MAG: DUF642 domain-containing protein [Actinomycetota bacterium]